MAALIGISLGITGGGGSILAVPILVYVFGISPILATSYSLFIVGSTALIGAANNYRKGLVSIKTALLFGMSSITTVFLTRKYLVPALPEEIFSVGTFKVTKEVATMLLLAILMVMASIAMINNQTEIKPLKSKDEKSGSNLPKLLLYGVAIGLVTGLLGAGGGFLLIPALVLLLDMPMKEAVGTSLLIIALNSLIGFTGDLGHYIIDWKFLVTITMIAVAGIFVGGYFAKKIEGPKLKKAFGWFVLLTGIYIVIRELFFNRGG